MQEYFPEIGNDLTVVTWGHAVNSKQKLQDALDEKLMMLEADVVMGTVEGGSEEEIPIMAHPPSTTSDLSLKGFLTTVVNATKNGHRCGVKLDFKSVEVLMPSLQELYEHKQIDFPVMLNADILPGPVNSTTIPVDADTFLELCAKLFPESTLSVGWTTRYGDLVINGSYSEEQVEAMEDALDRKQVTQPVTFPVRAGLAAKSGNTLTRLKNINNSTFTIWSSEDDPVDVDLLRELILNTLGRDRVYVDVPKSLSDELQLPPSNTTKTSSACVSSLSTLSALVTLTTTLVQLFKP
ncbi:protein FAM151B isoform X2 [Periplaneta americana]